MQVAGIYEIMSEEKGNQTERISFKVQDLKGFFPKNFTQNALVNLVKQFGDKISQTDIAEYLVTAALSPR